MKKIYFLYILVYITLLTGCKKDLTCLTCQEILVRFTYSTATDTIIEDYALQSSPSLAPYNSDFYVMQGYSRKIDTIKTGQMYNICYEYVQYGVAYKFNSYFYDNYCQKQ